MGTIKGDYVLLWTNPGSNTRQNISCTAKWLPKVWPPSDSQKYGHQVTPTSMATKWLSQVWPPSDSHKYGPTYKQFHKPTKWNEQDMLGILRKVRTNSYLMFWTPVHGHSSVNRSAKTYILEFCTDTGCRIEGLSVAMAKRDWWQERVKEICAVSTTWWWCIHIHQSLQLAYSKPCRQVRFGFFV